MRALAESSLRFQFLVIALAAAALVLGIGQLGRMPVDVLPEFSPPYVEIQTEALGLSAEEVEQMITVPMEQDLLAGVAWLDVIRSESVPGLSSVLVYFEPGTDLYQARQMVTERLSQAAVGLPHVSKPPTMIQPLSSASRFLIVGLSSDELSLIQTSVLARWVIAPRLMGVPGVAHVAIWGQRERQLQVLVDPERLRAQGVTLDQVVETTGNALWVSSLSFLEASTPGAGGFIDTPNQRLGVWHVLPISSPEDLAEVPVVGSSLLLRDVAELVEDHQPLIGDAVINDSPNLLLAIEKLPGINTLEVTRGVETALDALRPGFAAIDFDATLFRPATFIELGIDNLGRSVVLAALLTVVVLGALTYSWRAALISLVAIPAALIAALFVLYLRGETLNALVLAGLVIALAIVVDEAVIEVDHIVGRLRENRAEGGHRSTRTVILEATVEMRGAAFFATLAILLSVIPLAFLEGVPADLLRVLAVSYALAVLAAMLVALTVTPALSGILLAGPSLEQRLSPLVRWLQAGYAGLLRRSFARAWLAYALLALTAVLGLAALAGMAEGDLLPAFREPYLTVRLEAPPATSRPEMDRILARASQELRSIPGIRNVGGHVGRAVFGDRVVGINSAELWLSLDSQADYDATLAAVQETVDGYTGLDREVQSYLQQTLSEPLARTGQAVTVRIFGEQHEVLRREAEAIGQELTAVEGVADLQVELPIEEPTVEIEVDLAAAQQHGVKPGDVRRAAATLLSGLQVGSLFEEQKVFDVVVWSTPENRDSLTDIRELLIETPGGHVRLEEVAEVRITPSPAVIRREGVASYLDIGLNLEDRNIGRQLGEVEAVLKSHAFPLEYHAELLGDFAARQEVQQRVLTAVAVAVTGVFLLLQASTGSWRLAAATLFSLPAMLAGGVLASFAMGGSLPLASLLGLLAVLGIGLRNSILLIRHCQQLVQAGLAFGPELAIRGAQERMAPVVTSALASVLALVPFVVFGDLPGLEIARPTGIVILGGLAASSALSLFALPALYLRFGAAPVPAAGPQPVPAVGEA